MTASHLFTAKETIVRLLAVVALSLLVGCMIPPAEIAPRQDPAPKPIYGATEDRSNLFEQYFLENLDLNPRSGTSLGMQK